jgi:hypothetical protein
LSSFEVLYVKSPGLPRCPQYPFPKVCVSTFSPKKLACRFSPFLSYWHLNRPYSSQFWKSQKTENVLSTITFAWKSSINDQVLKFCSHIAKFRMLRTYFVATNFQKKSIILVSYSWNYMVYAYRQRRFPCTIEFLNNLISCLIKLLRKSGNKCNCFCK